ncbi:MAG: sarcosine oxidase subunit delta [Actinomycetota bacterium]
MSLLVPCPFCGERPYAEFTFGGELRPVSSPDVKSDFARLYLRENVAGVQEERWFHAYGCRRWLTLRRDTTTNTIEA